jgi:hypothetical protein
MFSLVHIVQTGSGAEQTYTLGNGGYLQGDKAAEA